MYNNNYTSFGNAANNMSAFPNVGNSNVNLFASNSIPVVNSQQPQQPQQYSQQQPQYQSQQQFPQTFSMQSPEQTQAEIQQYKQGNDAFKTENAKLKSQIDQYTQICNQLESMKQNYETVKKQCDTEMEDIDKEIALVQNALNQ